MASLSSHSSADRIPETADLLQKMSLDSQPNAADSIDASTEPSLNEVDTGSTTNRQWKPYELSTTPVLPDYVDPSMYYMANGYFYGAYDGKEWNDYAKMLSAEGVDLQSGSYGYTYAPYGPYSPAVSPGLEGQLYGAQQYQYPTSYYQPVNANGAKVANTQLDTNKQAVANQKPLSTEKSNHSVLSTANGGAKLNNGSASGDSSKLIFSTPSYYQPKSVFDGVRSLWQDSPDSDLQADSKTTTPIASSKNRPSVNQILHQKPNYMASPQTRSVSGMGTAQGFINTSFSNNIYGQYTNAYRPGMSYGSYNTYDSRAHTHKWSAVDGKYRPKGRGYGLNGYSNESAEGSNELNRGPRGKSANNTNGSAPLTLAVKGQALPTSKTKSPEMEGVNFPAIDEHYNQPDFAVVYEHAKFFVIKSYSEDDVHKSVKYNMWASTPNGNKKLDAAYREAQEIAGGCPVFLFFSVNASGQFVGVAEMAGPVDFDKTLDYWQQDKWNGCFPLKWKIVKDVPNALLKHIILANNENKPVTNSRDTQEVKLEQGLQMLKIFKDHVSRTSIVDDFGFYEARQKAIQEKKTKQQQFQKQVWEGMLAAEEKKDKSNEVKKLSETDLDAAEKEPQMV